MVKNLPAMQETWVQSLSQEDPLEEGMATHSNIFAWRILRTEEPGRLQSIGSQSRTRLKQLSMAGHIVDLQAFLVAQWFKKKSACQCRRHKETRVQSMGQEDPLEEDMATHSRILAWEIPWTEEPGGLQSMMSQKSQIRLSD